MVRGNREVFVTSGLRLVVAICVVVLFAIQVTLAIADTDSTPRLRTGKAVRLFNGKDLTGFYTWLAGHRHDDPDRVYTVARIDGAPAIRISGQGFGGLITTAEYDNFILDAEFRWGERTWAPREKCARDSGILVRCQDPDGSASAAFDSPWMRSVEYQVIEGGTGDFILIPGYDRGGAAQNVLMTALVAGHKDAAGQAIYDPAGSSIAFAGGRIDWYGRDPAWQDVLGFRGKQDVESPVGKWTRVRIICNRGSITAMVNGRVVNSGSNCSLLRGKILFQSECAEIYYRKIVLTPLL
jgi:hypothetical protein